VKEQREETPPSLVLRTAGRTDVGCVRERNEDAFRVDDENRLYIVADGMGGHQAGDVAARMVVDLLPGVLANILAESPVAMVGAEEEIGERLQRSVAELTVRIRDEARRQPGLADMGATIVAAWITPRHAHLVHMGDSRAYLFRRGLLERLTGDHTLVDTLLRHGSLTEQEAEHHPLRSGLLRYVGMPGRFKATVSSHALHAGDRLLLCTDGVWSMLQDPRLAAILKERRTPDRTCGDLIALGRTAGGKDNLTAIMIDVHPPQMRV